MPLVTYKLLHWLGIAILLLGLGCALATARGPGGGRGLAMLMHGVGLLLVLVAGFGLQAKSSIGFPAWLWAKVGAWVLLAILPALVRRGVLSVGTALVVAGGLAGGAAYLVLYRPF
jgi:hypothetical protein